MGRSPGEGNGNRFQDSCLENPMDRGAHGAMVHGVAKSQTRLNEFHAVTHFMPQVARCQNLCFSSWSVFLAMGSTPGPSTGYPEVLERCWPCQHPSDRDIRGEYTPSILIYPSGGMSLECVLQIVYWAPIIRRVGCPEKPSLYLFSFCNK